MTGATGKAGRAAVQELREHGYNVVATDAVAGEQRGAVLRADLTDYGEATEVLRGTNAVVHLANIPAPGLATPAITFNANITMNFNVFHAAAALGLRKVVWASSETTLGLPFGGGPQQIPGVAGAPPRYAPVDEDHYPYPTTTYALSKVASETIAAQITRWSGIPFVGLRISNIMDPDEYQRFPSFWPDPQLRKWNVWGYVDVRDVAAACRLGLEAEVTGSQNVIIAAADTGHEPPVPRRARRGLPRRAGDQGRRRVRHAAGDRPRQGPARLRARPLLARLREVRRRSGPVLNNSDQPNRGERRSRKALTPSA